MLLSTGEAAARIGVSIEWIQKLIAAGRLPATKVGRYYVVDDQDLAATVASIRPGPGRPPKPPREKRPPGRPKKVQK